MSLQGWRLSAAGALVLVLASCGCREDGGILVSSGSLAPCGGEFDLNGNGLLDADEIQAGTRADVNRNGIVDEVELDVDGDGQLDGRILAGRVWSDVNRNGRIDADEPGIEHVLVTAEPMGGAPARTTRTAADGTWRIDGVAMLPSVLVRFGESQEPFFPAYAGIDSHSSLRLVEGSSASLNHAMHVPQTAVADAARGARLATSCYASGLAAGSTHVALTSWSLLASDLPLRYGGTAEDARPDATVDELGAVWGQAYDPFTSRMFLGAMARRHVGVAAAGLGAVHVMRYDASAATKAGEFSLEGVVPANAASPISGSPIRLGSILRTGAPEYELHTSPTAPSWDIDGFDKVGRAGFGDLDMSADGRTLWAINLNQRAILAMALDPDSVAPTQVRQWLGEALPGWPEAPTDGANAPTGQVVPWALKITPNRGYVGCVANAEFSQDPADLRAYVLAFDPGAVEAGFELVYMMRLDYRREPVLTSQPQFGTPPIPGEWHPWARDWNDTPYAGVANVVLAGYPQPILSDIEIAPDGALVLGFTDRFGHQGGSWNYTPVPGNTDTMLCTPGGDILRACRTATGWTQEGPDCPTLGDPGNYFPDDGLYDTGLEFLADDGPSGVGEFYYMDGFYRGGYGPLHPETVGGGLCVRRGAQEVTTTVYDPLSNHPTAPRGGVTAQGTHAYSTASGTLERAYYVVYTDLSITNVGKSVGLGDLEVVGPTTPFEIGNQVFLDRDRSGAQSPGDVGLPNIELALRYQGVEVARTRTDSHGTYAFRADELRLADGSPSMHAMVPDSAAYEVVIDVRAPGNRVALRGLVPILQDAGEDDALDSDGDHLTRPGLIVAPARTPGLDRVRHDVDFGFLLINQVSICDPR